MSYTTTQTNCTACRGSGVHRIGNELRCCPSCHGTGAIERIEGQVSDRLTPHEIDAIYHRVPAVSFFA